jgi:hypothetical protein
MLLKADLLDELDRGIREIPYPHPEDQYEHLGGYANY